MFQFYHDGDMIRVIEEGLWIYDQNLIVMSKLKGDLPMFVLLNRAYFWIHGHDILVGYFTLNNTKRISNFVRRFVNVEEYNFYAKWNPFMGIRLNMDFGKPLKRNLFLQKVEGINLCVTFHYEKLPIFCFCVDLLDTPRIITLVKWRDVRGLKTYHWACGLR
ncbi:unnamed protein product [Cuscuta europaea]|uniref:Zinc knuckle CX2CX4HX4C domain-containing protein n=1 Tax=Cuscuta europaea TaxID=41803 RepID=A0A9P0YTZ4_CUSEU|nr:unnamed protein product [Cuscuta europaea]